MNSALISITTIVLYLASTALLGMRLFARGRTTAPQPALLTRASIIALAGIAVIFHAVTLSQHVFTEPGLNLGVSSAISLMTWLIAVLLLLASLSQPLESLGIIILPSAALAVILGTVYPGSHIVASTPSKELQIHILVSIVAYAVLSIAAIQSLLLAIQDHQLRRRHPTGFIRALPPLQTMETLLFQMIGLGFILHSFALLTGAMYLEDMFAQHLVHKTILSIVAWVVFAVLLWGRWHYGWRGQTAIRLTLSGFVVLLLAYFGSKLVLEVLLHRA